MARKKALSEIEPTLHTMIGKYMDLVWYARSAPEGDASWSNTPRHIQLGVFESQANVEAKYGPETSDLKDPDIGDYNHGFNSGMLAALRFVVHSFYDGVESAESEFPELYI